MVDALQRQNSWWFSIFIQLFKDIIFMVNTSEFEFSGKTRSSLYHPNTQLVVYLLVNTLVEMYPALHNKQAHIKLLECLFSFVSGESLGVHFTNNFFIKIHSPWKFLSACYQNSIDVIATKFCTCHDSFVVTCAKICGNLIPSNWITSIWIFHKIWIVIKKSLMKLVPWQMWLQITCAFFMGKNFTGKKSSVSSVMAWPLIGDILAKPWEPAGIKLGNRNRIMVFPLISMKPIQEKLHGTCHEWHLYFFVTKILKLKFPWRNVRSNLAILEVCQLSKVYYKHHIIVL